jgi:hypothetical protein
MRRVTEMSHLFHSKCISGQDRESNPDTCVASSGTNRSAIHYASTPGSTARKSPAKTYLFVFLATLVSQLTCVPQISVLPVVLPTLFRPCMIGRSTRPRVARDGRERRVYKERRRGGMCERESRPAIGHVKGR